MKHTALLVFISILALFACREKASNKPKGPLTLAIETKELPGFKEPHTPAQYNKVGYNRYYLQNQEVKNVPVLVIISGYIAGTGWFDRMAKDLVKRKNCEVWTIIRRQAYYEKRNELKRDIDTYITLTNETARKRLMAKLNQTKNYMQGVPEPIAHWGLDVQLEDIKLVVEQAKKHSNNIYLGGWSDGVEYVMAYAHYKFASTGFGHKDLKGMVFFDENPEWGWATKKEKAKWLDDMIKVQDKLMAKKGTYYYMNYYPSIAAYVLAGELAWRHPEQKSPLAEVYGQTPKDIQDQGITNQAFLGWLYDLSVEHYAKSIRGPFAYLVRSGDLSLPEGFVTPGTHKDTGKDAKNMTGNEKKETKTGEKGLITWKSFKDVQEVTDLQDVINSTQAPGYLWELFYPRKILLDYWKISACDFDCPELNIYPSKANRLPIFYILTTTNNVGNTTPLALTWYMTKNSIKLDQVTFKRMYHYSHGDMFFAKKAPEELYAPLYRWMLKQSGMKKTEQ